MGRRERSGDPSRQAWGPNPCDEEHPNRNLAQPDPRAKNHLPRRPRTRGPLPPRRVTAHSRHEIPDPAREPRRSERARRSIGTRIARIHTDFPTEPWPLRPDPCLSAADHVITRSTATKQSSSIINISPRTPIRRIDHQQSIREPTARSPRPWPQPLLPITYHLSLSRPPPGRSFALRTCISSFTKDQQASTIDSQSHYMACCPLAGSRGIA